jgi:hypothetical protein
MKIALEELLVLVPEFHLQREIPIRTLLHSTLQPDILPLEWRAN